MNPTFERLLDQQSFVKDFEACETIEEQITFCTEFLRKYGPLPEKITTYSGEKYANVEERIRTQHGVAETVHAQVVIDRLERTQNPSHFVDARMRLHELIMKELMSGGYLELGEYKKFETDEVVYTARLGVVRLKQKW